MPVGARSSPATTSAPLQRAIPRRAHTLAARVDRLLTWKRACVYALLLCGLYVVAYASVILNGSPPFNSSHEPIGGDYIAFYTAGRLLLSGEGAQLYDPAHVSAVQDELLGHGIPHFYDAFRNPPFYALVYAPLAALDLIPSFVVWSLLSLAALAAAVWLALDRLPALRARWRGVAILTFAFGPVYFGVIDGENATLSLLLYMLLYRSLVQQQDGQAGLWAALGLFKPQLFFVFPLVFLAARRWRGLASYLGTALVLGLISLAVVGPAGIAGWLRILVEMETGNATRNAWRMHSLKAFFDLLLPGMPLAAIALYAAASAALLALLVRVWVRRPADLRLPFVFTSLVAVLVDPHLVDYDLTVLVLAGLLGGTLLRGLRWWMLALYPVLMLRAQVPVEAAAIQLSTLVLIACAVIVWRSGRLGSALAGRPQEHLAGGEGAIFSYAAPPAAGRA